MDRWHINEKEEMEVSDKLEAAYLYMLNMRRSMISEACVQRALRSSRPFPPPSCCAHCTTIHAALGCRYEMQRDDFKDRQHYAIRGVWRRFKERKAAEKKAREDAKPKYVDLDDLEKQVTTKAVEKNELLPAEIDGSSMSEEFPSADDTPEEEYAQLISEEHARRERQAAIDAGLIEVRQPVVLHLCPALAHSRVLVRVPGSRTGKAGVEMEGWARRKTKGWRVPTARTRAWKATQRPKMPGTAPTVMMAA